MILLFSTDSHLEDTLLVAVGESVEVRRETDLNSCLMWGASSQALILAVVVDCRAEHGGYASLVESLFRRLRGVPIIAVTAGSDGATAFEVAHRGAIGWLGDDADSETMRRRLQEILGRKELPARPVPTGTKQLVGLEGRSSAIETVRSLVIRAAASDESVLIAGETGVGKELVAHAIHQLSPRHDRAFVVANAPAISEGLFESELFGSRQGAYTGARDRRGLFGAADRGTLFLDEIADLSSGLQPKLLRAVEYGTIRAVGSDSEEVVDVRVVSATNRPLEPLIRAGAFRRDLWHRLAGIIVRVPPLRERMEDLPDLCYAVLRSRGLDDVELTPPALRLLATHGWPGNIRELCVVLTRSVILSGRKRIGAGDICLDDDYLSNRTYSVGL